MYSFFKIIFYLREKIYRKNKQKLQIAKFNRFYQELLSRKISIDRPGGIHFFSTHNFWIIHKRTKIKTYSEKVETFLSEYAFMIVLWQVVQKLCVEKKWIPFGLYRFFTISGIMISYEESCIISPRARAGIAH